MICAWTWIPYSACVFWMCQNRVNIGRMDPGSILCNGRLIMWTEESETRDIFHRSARIAGYCSPHALTLLREALVLVNAGNSPLTQGVGCESVPEIQSKDKFFWFAYLKIYIHNPNQSPVKYRAKNDLRLRCGKPLWILKSDYFRVFRWAEIVLESLWLEPKVQQNFTITSLSPDYKADQWFFDGLYPSFRHLSSTGRRKLPFRSWNGENSGAHIVAICPPNFFCMKSPQNLESTLHCVWTHVWAMNEREHLDFIARFAARVEMNNPKT